MAWIWVYKRGGGSAKGNKGTKSKKCQPTSGNHYQHARYIEVVHIAGNIKALRIGGSDEASIIDLCVTEPKFPTTVVFSRHGGKVLTGFQCLNPALHTPDGQCLEAHTPGVSLRDLVAYIGQGNAARAYVADMYT